MVFFVSDDIVRARFIFYAARTEHETLETFGKKFHICLFMKLFLIDGHALVFKMYYAFLGRPMVNSKGVDTSILYGFTKYLLELIDREQPTHIAVSFDPPGGSFRNTLYPQYKANRAETPELVIAALEPLSRIVRAMNIHVLMLQGYEADDVIGSAAKHFCAQDMDVYMVTPDKDYGQLVEPHILQYKPGKSGADNEVLGPAEICAKWNISNPLQVIDILTICGDSSDNVPGVQGVGPVGAAKLLGKYGSVEGIYEHIGELTPRQQQLFEAARDHIALSKQLVTIKTDIPIDTTQEELRLRMDFGAELQEIVDEYEFPSLKRLILKISGNVPSVVAGHPHDEEIPVLQRCDAGNFRPERMGVLLSGGKIYLSSASGYCEGSPETFRALLEDESIVKVGWELKAMMNSLASKGIRLRGKLEDIELMHYLLNPERSHKLDTLAASYLGVDLNDGADVVQVSLFDEPETGDGADRLRELGTLLPLADKLNAEMDATPGIRSLYDELEEPLIRVLSSMERTGVKVDLASLGEYAEGLRVRMVAKEAEVRELAGEPELNVSSPKQVGTVIYEKLKLDPKAKKPKSGNWPTDEQTLLTLSERSPIIDAILEYRGLRKLLSTYIEPFATWISPTDGRVHTTFNQALTSTGRLSSSNPNLQNIPIRSDEGREIRKAFVPEGKGMVMMSADYSQIELRIMAHLSGDEHLTLAFRAGQDVHAATASKIFGVRMEEVTPEQRRIAKTANFGIMYGISAFGLSQRLHCPRAEAKKIIDDYFASFPSIRGYIDHTLAEARRNGYVETLFGRRRYIADLNSRNVTVRSLAERNAVNAPIQGTAADIIKKAMITVDSRLRENGLRSRMVLQIHDELLLEVPEDEIACVRELLTDSMETVIRLSIPLTVECKYGNNWLEAH